MRPESQGHRVIARRIETCTKISTVVHFWGSYRQELASASSTDAGELYHSALAVIDSASQPFMPKRNIEDYSDKIVRIGDGPVAWGAASSVWIAELYGKRVILHAMPNRWVSKKEFYDFVVRLYFSHRNVFVKAFY